MAIVVTGATGNVGRPLVAELVAAGAEVRAVSRRPDAAELPAEVKVVDTAAAAIPGASAVFLNSRALGEEMASAVRQAQREGVSRWWHCRRLTPMTTSRGNRRGTAVTATRKPTSWRPNRVWNG